MEKRNLPDLATKEYPAFPKDPRKKKMSALEKKFAHRWVMDCNTPQSYIDAGYTCDPNNRLRAGTNGNKVLNRPHVKAYIEQLLEQSENERKAKIEQVALELRRILMADVADALEVREDGTPTNAFRPMPEWPEDLRRAVASLEIKELYEKDEDGNVALVGYLKKVRFWNKTDAAHQLLKKLGGFAPEQLEARVSLATLVGIANRGEE